MGSLKKVKFFIFCVWYFRKFHLLLRHVINLVFNKQITVKLTI